MPTLSKRHTRLKAILAGRRLELQDDLQRRIRIGRHDRDPRGGDELETSEARTSEDVEFALLQVKTETLRHIDEALGRLDAGQYGDCAVCGADIAEARLRAVPFAVRCLACEAGIERGQARARRHDQQLAGFTLASSAARASSSEVVR